MSNENSSLEDASNPNGLRHSIGNEDSSLETKSDDPAPDLSTHRFECRVCSYVYDPREGVNKLGIKVGTPFLELNQSEFRCPVCRAPISSFKDIGSPYKPSGFKENLNYGFGVNNLTPGQKNVLIFGGLAFFLACFLSLYSLN